MVTPLQQVALDDHATSVLVIDDLSGEITVAPGKKLEDLIHLAELCVDLLQQNEEHYAEVGMTYDLHTSDVLFRMLGNRFDESRMAI